VTSTRKGVSSIFSSAKLIFSSAKLFVKPVQILKIDSESDAHQKIKNAPNDRPLVGRVGIVPQFPEPKEEKKDRGCSDQNFVRR
jgi:hypothetical protein